MHQSTQQASSEANPGAHFGALLSRHPGKFSVGGWGWYIGAIFVLGGIATFIAALSGKPEADPLLGLASLAIGLAVLVVPVLRWRQAVNCFEHGLVWQHLLGDKTVRRADVIDVRLVHHRGKHTNHQEIVIETANGKLSIVGIHNAEQVVSYIGAWLSGRSVAGAFAGPSHAPNQPHLSQSWAPRQGGSW